MVVVWTKVDTLCYIFPHFYWSFIVLHLNYRYENVSIWGTVKCKINFSDSVFYCRKRSTDWHLLVTITTITILWPLSLSLDHHDQHQDQHHYHNHHHYYQYHDHHHRIPHHNSNHHIIKTTISTMTSTTISSCCMVKSRLGRRCGLANRMPSLILTVLWICLNVGANVQTTEVIMLLSNCVKLQNKVQEIYHFFFWRNIQSYYGKKWGIPFQHALIFYNILSPTNYALLTIDVTPVPKWWLFLVI